MVQSPFKKPRAIRGAVRHPLDWSHARYVARAALVMGRLASRRADQVSRMQLTAFGTETSRGHMTSMSGGLLKNQYLSWGLSIPDANLSHRHKSYSVYTVSILNGY